MVDKKLFDFLHKNCAVVNVNSSGFIIIYNPIGEDFFHEFNNYFGDRYEYKASDSFKTYTITKKKDDEISPSPEEWALDYCKNVQVKHESKDIEMWNLTADSYAIVKDFDEQWFRERYRIFLELGNCDCILLKYID